MLPVRPFVNWHLLRSGISEKSTAHDDRAGFQPTLFGCIELPCLFEPVYIATIDLRQRRVMIAFRLSAIDWPVGTVGRRIALARLTLQNGRHQTKH